MSRSFSFVHRLLFNCLYYLRLAGLKVKFLWDTLNHYLLIRQIGRAIWREKPLSLLALSFISYFGYFREAFFIDSARQKIWMFEVA